MLTTEPINTHLYNCYLQGLYPDIQIRVSSKTNKSIDGLVYNCHKIIISQSPVLASLITKDSILDLVVEDPCVTPIGLGLTISFLYSRTIDTEPLNVLASAKFLELNELVRLLVAQVTLTKSNVLKYCELVENADLYGLESRVERFLCVDVLQGQDPMTLTELYAQLSFDWLKRVLEHKDFQVPSRIRFSLGKEIVALRKPRVTGEENILLSFGQGPPVTLVRKKQTNDRRIWKAAE